MESVFLIPRWFFGIDMALEVVFAIVTLFIAGYAMRIGRFCEKKEPKFFAVGFLFIGLSYLARGLINIIVAKDLTENITVLEVREVSSLIHFGVYAYMTLFAIGIISLVYMTLKTEKISFYPILLITTLLPLFLLKGNVASYFYIFSTVILVYLATHYMVEYKANKNAKTRYSLIAFSLLALASLVLYFASLHYVSYVISHILELVAYSILLTNLIKVAKNEQKKK